MSRSLRYWYQQRKAAKHGITLTGMQHLTPASVLILEAHTRLREVQICLPDSSVPLRMGAFSYIRTGSRVQYLSEVGRYCSIGRNVVLGETPRNHPIDWVSTHMALSSAYKAEHSHTRIGHDVWIGHDAVIMAGVSIGTGAVIARNAIVTKDVAPYQIVGGNPARPIRFRFSQAQREALLQSEWWKLDYDALRRLPFDDIDRFLQGVKEIEETAQFARIQIKNRRVSTL